MTDANQQAELAELRLRLEEAEETIRAIRSGAVDAFVIEVPHGAQVYTLQTADRPLPTAGGGDAAGRSHA